MKLNTFRKYTFTAGYSGYTTFTDPDTGASQKTYQDPIKIKCWVSNNALGQLMLYTKARLQNDGGIGNLRNNDRFITKGADLVYPIGTVTGAVWRIIEGMPMYDSLGNVYEYKYRCQMIVPSLGSVTEAAPSEFTNGGFWNF
jgi:hypothetical protein